MNLKILSFLRSLKIFFFEWGILFSIYLGLCAFFLRPFLDFALGETWSLVWIALGVLGYLFLILALSMIPYGFKLPMKGRPLVRHEIRKLSTWVTLILTLGFMLYTQEYVLSLLVGLSPLHQSLMRAWRWRILYAQRFTGRGGTLLVDDYMQLGICYVFIFALCSPFLFDAWEEGVVLMAGHLGASLAGASCSMEGDSGQPFMVNLVVIVAGALGAVSCFLFPPALLGWGYFYWKMRGIAKRRALSLQWPYEDVIIP